MTPHAIGEILSVAMFLGVVGLLMLGYPVAFTLGGAAVLFALAGHLVGAFDLNLLSGVPSRYFGVMTNEVLVAVPLFVFMGVMLERSRIAEQLLATMGRLFGGLRGGLGISVVLVGTLLAVFLGAGAVGTLVAGPIADRIGVRRYVVGVFILATPIAAGVLFVQGVWIFVLLGALGFVLVSTFTVSVVLGQAYLPRHAGMASGLIVGFAIGLGGAGVTVLGWVADRWGVPTALWISALTPLVAFVLTRLLPAPRDATA